MKSLTDNQKRLAIALGCMIAVLVIVLWPKETAAYSGVQASWTTKKDYTGGAGVAFTWEQDKATQGFADLDGLDKNDKQVWSSYEPDEQWEFVESSDEAYVDAATDMYEALSDDHSEPVVEEKTEKVEEEVIISETDSGTTIEAEEVGETSSSEDLFWENDGEITFTADPEDPNIWG